MTFSRTIALALAAAYIHDMRLYRRIRERNNRLKQQNEMLIEHYGAALRETMYLSAVLDAHGIQPDEFDKIALANLRK